MKYGTLVSVIGAVGMLSLFSMHTARAAVTVDVPAVAADQHTAPLGKPIDLPEPATWTMLILGFGAIGATVRHGRAKRLRAASIG